MSKREIFFKNDFNGITLTAIYGFSWTNLFFGFLVPLYRKDWTWGLAQLILAIGTSGITTLLFPFVYNRLYINKILREGYKPVFTEDITFLETHGFDL